MKSFEVHFLSSLGWSRVKRSLSLPWQVSFRVFSTIILQGIIFGTKLANASEILEGVQPVKQEEAFQRTTSTDWISLLFRNTVSLGHAKAANPFQDTSTKGVKKKYLKLVLENCHYAYGLNGHLYY